MTCTDKVFSRVLVKAQNYFSSALLSSLAHLPLPKISMAGMGAGPECKVLEKVVSQASLKPI